jgi:cobalamin biosynthesis protein CobD/CbiB
MLDGVPGSSVRKKPRLRQVGELIRSRYRARMDLFWGKIAWLVVVAAVLAAIWYCKSSRKPP